MDELFAYVDTIKPDVNIEIEARFGFYKKGEFIPGVNDYIFQILMGKLRENTSEFKLQDTITDIVEIFTDDGIRSTRIETSTNPRLVNTIKNEIKRRLFIKDVKNFQLRFAVSKEESILGLTFVDKPDVIRKRNRKVFLGISKNTKNIKIDLTTVNTYKGDEWYTSNEVEIECISRDCKNNLDITVGKILDYIQGGYHIPLSERLPVITFYNVAIMNVENPPKFQLNDRYANPKDLKKRHLFSMDGYTITNKADGVRRRLILLNGMCYIADPPFRVALWNINSMYKLKATETEIVDKTILEGEVVVTNKGDARFLVYDCIIYRGKRVFTEIKDHSKRLEFANFVLSRLKKDSNVQMKYFLDSTEGNCYVGTRKILEFMESLDYKNDGIIYTPRYVSYEDLASTTNLATILKWKYPSSWTMDFKLNRIGTSRDIKNGIFELQIYKGSRKEPIYQTFEATLKEKYTSSEMPSSEEISTNRAFLPLSGYETGDIVEMRWDEPNKTFVPVRKRYDKNLPNFVGIALDVWHSIHHIVAESTIKGEDLILMKKWHTEIKRYWLNNLLKNSVILDIGSGKGSDILGWKNNNIKVYATDPSEANLSEVERRVKYFEYPNSVVICKARGQDTSLIKKCIGEVQIYGVTIFQSMTFFFNTEDDLKNLLNTIVAFNPTFVLIFMLDGQKVMETLKLEGGKIDNPAFTIIPKVVIPSTSKFSIGYGKKVVVSLSGTEIQNQVEYLTDYLILGNMMTNKGYNIFYSELVDPYGEKYLSDYAKIYSSMNRLIIFSRKDIPILEGRTGKVLKAAADVYRRVSVPKEKIKPIISIYEESVRDLKWDFYMPRMIRLGIISDDGACLFHAFLRSFYGPYIISDNTKRKEIVCEFREGIAKSISKKVFEGLVAPKYEGYDYESFKESISTCKKMSGSNVIEYLIMLFGVNIYIIDSDTLKPKKYIHVVKPDLLNNDSTILLLYIDKQKHYELLGYISYTDNKYKFIFESEEDFIGNFKEDVYNIKA